MVRKIYIGILVEKVLCRVNEGLTDDEYGSFGAGIRYVDQIFALK